MRNKRKFTFVLVPNADNESLAFIVKREGMLDLLPLLNLGTKINFRAQIEYQKSSKNQKLQLVGFHKATSC